MLAPLLAGCVAINADVELQRDDRVNYTFHVEVRSDVAATELPESTDLCSAYLIGGNWFPDATSSEPTSRDGYIGCRVRGTTTIDKFGGSLLGDANLHVRHEGKEFVFSWRPSLGEDFPSRVDAFEVAVTFPGKVMDHSGQSTVSGTTVTWRNAADLTSAEGLYARGGDSPSVWDALARWGLYGGAAVALLAIVILVLRVRSRDRALAAAREEAASPGEEGASSGEAPPVEPAATEPLAASEGLSAADPVPPFDPPVSSGGVVETVAPPAPEQFWAPPAAAARWEVPPPETWAPGADEPDADESSDGDQRRAEQEPPATDERLASGPERGRETPSPWAPPAASPPPEPDGHQEPRPAE